MKKATSAVALAFSLAILASTLHGQVNSTASTAASQPPPLELGFRVDLRQLVPSTLAVAEGRYRIRIVNDLYVVPLDFSLHNAASVNAASAANKVAGAKTSDKGQRARFETDLHPGSYILTVTGHPELSSTLTVTSKGSK